MKRLLLALAVWCVTTSVSAGNIENARELWRSGLPTVAGAVLRPSIQNMTPGIAGDGEWLIEIYNRTGDDVAFIRLLDAPAFEKFDDNVKGLAHLARAERFLKDGQFDQAARYIQSNPISGTYKVRYDYLLANALAQSKQFKPAIEVFKTLVESAPDILRNLSILGLARTYHEIEDYPAAVFQYNRIDVLEPEFPEATFEKGWSYFLLDMPNGALGTMLTFRAPQFANQYFPEALVVRAASFYRLCYFDRAIDELRELKNRYYPVQSQVKHVLNGTKGPAAFAKVVQDPAAKRLNRLILNYLIHDPDFRLEYKRYKQMIGERSRFFRSVVSSGGGWGGGVRIVGQRSYEDAERRFGDLVREKLEALEVNIDSVLSKGELIEIEVLKTKEQQLKGERSKGALQARILQLSDYEVDELIHVWDFIGEFWLDELGSYYYGLASRCQESGQTFD